MGLLDDLYIALRDFCRLALSLVGLFFLGFYLVFGLAVWHALTHPTPESGVLVTDWFVFTLALLLVLCGQLLVERLLH